MTKICDCLSVCLPVCYKLWPQLSQDWLKIMCSNYWGIGHRGSELEMNPNHTNLPWTKAHVLLPELFLLPVFDKFASKMVIFCYYFFKFRIRNKDDAYHHRHHYCDALGHYQIVIFIRVVSDAAPWFSEERMKFATQIPPLLNCYFLCLSLCPSPFHCVKQLKLAIQKIWHFTTETLTA